MASCLGIYLTDDILKYAKLNIDNNKSIKLEAYGTRYIKSDKKEAILNIIEETNSKDIPIAINPQNDIYVNIQIYNQAQNKSFIPEVAKMEFEAWCEKNTKTIENYTFLYKVSDLKGPDGKHSGVLNIIQKKDVDEYSTIKNIKVNNMLPAKLLTTKLVPKDEVNYVLVNFDNEMSIETVINSQLVDIKTYQVGMNKILMELKEKTGSFAKAYEACKQLNVFSESKSSNNDKTIEAAVEPILQEILREISIVVNKNKKEIEKVLISGDGVVFTNIDILFREFLDVKCEILKPSFILDTSNVRNVAEMLEATQAMSLAYETLDPTNRDLDYIKSNNVIKNKFSSLFKNTSFKMPEFSKNKSVDNKTLPTTAGQVQNNKEIKPKESSIPKINFDGSKIFTGLVSASIVLGVVLVSYVLFSTMYVSNINKIIKENEQKAAELKTSISEIQSDTSTIKSNTEEYAKVNKQVGDLVEQIQTSKIGKFTTYNVATFLQGLIKIIPKNVQLNTISSDDNKSVKIVAQSTSYSDLGYFVAQLKLQGTLKNVKINNIKNGDTTSIQIGGELP